MSAAGSVRPDPDRPGTWRFVVDVPGDGVKRRQVKRRGFPTKKAAQAELDELKRATTAGRGVNPSRVPFGSFLTDRWLPHVAADTSLKPTTRAHYRRMARHLVEHAGAVRLDALRGDNLDRVYAALDGRSDSLRRSVHVVAHKALGDALRWRLVGFNAADDATAPAQSQPDPRAWTAEQVGEFLRVAADDRWSALWRLAATTGMRRGEMVGLRWSDIDLAAGSLVVANNVTVTDHATEHGTPKGNRARSMSLDSGTVAALKDWKRQQATERLAVGTYWPEGDFVFTWPDGALVHPAVVTRTFKRLRESVGLPELRLHSLRHAWATHALAAGVDVKDVATRLGHSSVRITLDVYVAPSSERDASAAATVADLYDIG